MVEKKVYEYSGDSRLAETKGKGNITSGIVMAGQSKDVFCLSRGSGMHGGKWSI